MGRRRLGQHFLVDAGWRARLLRALRISSADVWVEIGAGHGEMTAELARTARRVFAVELDSRLIERLRGLAEPFPNIEVIAADVLTVDLPARVGGRFKVFGNVPYYITSPILRRMFDSIAAIDSLSLVVQLEVAARLVARPGRRQYGYLSALTQFYTQPEIALRIPPGAFRPRPQVASALVHLRPPGERAALRVEDESRFLRFLQGCFAHKRKTLLNNLRAMLPPGGGEALVKAASLAPTVRAEQLNLRQFADLCARLKG